jgi:hypothetical protein
MSSTLDHEPHGDRNHIITTFVEVVARDDPEHFFLSLLTPYKPKLAVAQPLGCL